MYAVFRSGGKQHRVTEGQTIQLEKLHMAPGELVEFTEVLMAANDKELKIGRPFVDGSVIQAKVISDNYDKKLKIIKFRRRKHYRRHQGHRQCFTSIKITAIKV